jgi:chaperone BCS1
MANWVQGSISPPVSKSTTGIRYIITQLASRTRGNSEGRILTCLSTSKDWATAHQMTEVGRELKAVTFDSASPFTLLSNEDCKMFDESGLPSQNTLFNFQEWYSTRPLIFKPNFRGTYFWSHGNWFYWSTGQRENRCGEGYDRTIMIRCFGRSTKPIKNLLSSIKGFTLTKEIRTTQVFRNAIKPDDQGGYWLRQSVQPSRPMRTIALEQEQKARVILDINEYLHPATAHWYATRGIPYRRGYLFHGPPGTGKTSLSFALAGVFRLSIYCVSLGEIGLTDTDLATLFGSLPERCIVLLEDVDSAGFQQDDNDTHTFVKRSIAAPPETNSDSKNASFSKRSKGARSRSKRAEALESKLTGKEKIKSRSLITLAGLLNIIDGAASQIVSVTISLSNTNLHLSYLGTRANHDHQLPFDDRPCSDPTRPSRSTDRVYTRHAQSNL